MTLRKLFAIYLCASLRASLILAFVRVHWHGFKGDCASLWSIKAQPQGEKR